MRKVGGLVALFVVVVALRPAASEPCREEERDARGNCPVKKVAPPAPKPPAPKPPAPKPPAPVAPKVRPPDPPKPAPAVCPAGMVRVPAGTFQMGSADVTGDEHPQRTVTLSGYCIDRTEVTVKAFAACVSAGRCTAAKAPAASGLDQLCNGTRGDRQDHPVNCVDWNQATTYCGWASKRLPHEAEWEYAARGRDSRTYPWGNDAPTPRRLNACGSECVAMLKRLGLENWTTVMHDTSDGWEATAPVGSFPDGASSFGALDMAGNVWEWTADRYGSYAAGAATNPRGASSGEPRSNRGGGWHSRGAGGVRVAFRNRNGPAYQSTGVGFRCARGD